MSNRNASQRFYGVCERCFKEQWKHHPPGQARHCYCPHHQALAYESPEGVSIRTNVTIEEYNQIIARSTATPQHLSVPRRKWGR
ncbi:MAG: hypothetical protein HQL84_06840 [Magnetococcales bacterium]|nr:hypothetical protein [Magnetococcales bacterium]MBF0149748.1 hypothetical protein [Magnetococcales bacterium]MBF0174519.1 hypothetical protein [Magnetococcales bacterium]MBF0348167.1 hypothetical protein [Magnetococcales bacterium]MBF0630691.1 hypothetical protein [Magnetococcales bacterium]